MALDTTERRLITGSRDGTCCIWNVHNGQLLKIFKKPHGKNLTIKTNFKINFF
jgi:WD40 repeat protein